MNTLLRSKSGLNYNNSLMKTYLNQGSPDGRRVQDNPENPYMLNDKEFDNIQYEIYCLKKQ